MLDPAQSAIRDDSRLAALPPGIRLFPIHYFSYRESVIETALRKWASRMLSPLRRNEAALHALPSRNGGSPRSEGRPRGIPPTPGSLVLSFRRAQLARRHFAEWEDWSHRAASVGTLLAATTRYDVVASSGPPHMAHEAARLIACDRGLPLVIDFRDPWALDVYQPLELQSNALARLTQHYESLAVGRASLVVMNTELAAQMMRERYPDVSDRVITIMNGLTASFVSPASSDRLSSSATRA
ncbi:MAG: glycosyltransferase [Gemmatimonadaceae bacterium]